MNPWKSRPSMRATGTRLSSGTHDRILKLVLRAVRHTYGAESALRMAVRTGALEMLRAGASRQAMRDAIANCVVSHPSGLPDKPSLVTGESRASNLLTRMLAWTEDVSPKGPVRAAP